MMDREGSGVTIQKSKSYVRPTCFAHRMPTLGGGAKPAATKNSAAASVEIVPASPPNILPELAGKQAGRERTEEPQAAARRTRVDEPKSQTFTASQPPSLTLVPSSPFPSPPNTLTRRFPAEPRHRLRAARHPPSRRDRCCGGVSAARPRPRSLRLGRCRSPTVAP